MSTEPELPQAPRELLAPGPALHLSLIATPPMLVTALVAVVGGVAMPFSLPKVPLAYALGGALPFVAVGALLLARIVRRLQRERALLRAGLAVPAVVKAVRRVRGLPEIVVQLPGEQPGELLEASCRLMPRPLRAQADGRLEVDSALAGRLLRFDTGASRGPLELTALVDTHDPSVVVLPRLLGASFGPAVAETPEPTKD